MTTYNANNKSITRYCSFSSSLATTASDWLLAASTLTMGAKRRRLTTQAKYSSDNTQQRVPGNWTTKVKGSSNNTQQRVRREDWNGFCEIESDPVRWPSPFPL